MKKLNILHYTVGLKSNRGGGLTKYVDDLISVQKEKHNITFLYPGEYNLLRKKSYLKKEKSLEGVKIFSIINPLPLPMMFGIKNYDYLNRTSDINCWKEFLISNSIDIIHLHTFMGLFEEFLDAANGLNIPILYTTHDYFGICPKQTLFYNGKICDNYDNCVNCPDCNSLALSNIKTYIIHSNLFFKIRRFKFFKVYKAKEKRKADDISKEKSRKKLSVDFYKELRKKMNNYFSKIDYYHFNSSVTSNIFNNAFPNIRGEIVNISHKDITDNRVIKKFKPNFLKFTYLGPTTSCKGFDDIINAFDSVYENNPNFSLSIYSYTELKRPYLIKNDGGYQYNDLKTIFDKTDILLAPSKMYETFGFTVLEALSYGVPVITSKSIGAKDLIRNKETGFIIDNSDLKDSLKELVSNHKILTNINRNIYKMKFHTFYDHSEKIEKIYFKILQEKEKKI